IRLQGAGAADLISRSSRDDAASAGPRSHEADLSVQRTRHAAHRRVRHADSADRQHVEAFVSLRSGPPLTGRPVSAQLSSAIQQYGSPVRADRTRKKYLYQTFRSPKV